MSEEERSIEPSAAGQSSFSVFGPSSGAKEPMWVTVSWVLIPVVLGLLVAAAVWS